MKRYSKLIASGVGTFVIALVAFGVIPAEGSEAAATVISSAVGTVAVWFFANKGS